MDPGAIRPPRSSDFRDRARPAAQPVPTDLAPARTVTASATAAAARPTASEGSHRSDGIVLATVLDPAGQAMLDARAEEDKHGTARNRSALLRFRAYARPPEGAPEKDPDTDLQL